jgi:hypothetical protein
LVYQKILEFYKVALEVLSKSGARMVLRMMLDNVRLPEIVEDFLKRAGTLHKLVVNATQELLLEIKTMLYEQESMSHPLSAQQDHRLIDPSFTVAGQREIIPTGSTSCGVVRPSHGSGLQIPVVTPELQ